MTVSVSTPPTVSLNQPRASATSEPREHHAQRPCQAADGTIAQVQFFQGTTLLATRTTPPYSTVWTGAPAGTTASRRGRDGQSGYHRHLRPAHVTVNAPVAQLYFIHHDQ